MVFFVFRLFDTTNRWSNADVDGDLFETYSKERNLLMTIDVPSDIFKYHNFTTAWFTATFSVLKRMEEVSLRDGKFSHKICFRTETLWTSNL